MDEYEYIDISGNKDIQPETTNPDQLEIDDDSNYEYVDISAEGFSTDPIDDAPYKDDAVVSHFRGSDDLDGAMEKSKGDLDWSLQTSMGMSPKEAKQISDLSKSMQLPMDVVMSNLKKTQNMASHKGVSDRILARNEDGTPKYPKTLKYMKDPVNASFSKNDYENLSEIEAIKHKRDKEDEGFFEEVFNQVAAGSAGIGQSFADIPGFIYQAAAYPQNKLADVFDAPSLRADTPVWLKDNPVSEYYEKQQELLTSPKTHESAVDQIFSKGEYGKGAYNLFLQTMGNAPVLATMAMGGISGLSSRATMGMMGGMESTTNLKEGLDRGKHPAKAFEGAVLSGIAEGLFERYTIDSLGKVFKKTAKELVETIGKDSAKKVILKNTYELVKAAGIEGSSESFTSIAQDMSDYITGEKNAMDGATERALNAGLAGMMPGGTLKMLEQSRTHIARSRFLAEQHDTMQKAADMIDTTELKELSVDGAENFIEGVIGKGSVYVELDDIKEFQQNRKKEGEESDPDKDRSELREILEDLGVTDQIGESEAGGVQLEVSSAKWAAKIANTEMGQMLRDDIRFGMDGISNKESALIKKDVNAQLDEMKTSMRDTEHEALQIEVESFRNVLMRPTSEGGQGRSAEYTDDALSLLLAGAATFGKKDGGGAANFLKKYNLQIESGGTYGESDAKTIQSNQSYEEIVKNKETRKAVDPETLEGDAKILYQENLDYEIDQMVIEISQARKGGLQVIPGKTSTDTPTSVDVPGNFPAYYKGLKVQNQAALRKAAQNKKGAVYNRMKEVAIERMINGYKNEISGEVAPNSQMRSLIGLSESRLKEDDDFTLFQRDKSGFVVREDEVIHEMANLITNVVKPKIKKLENVTKLGKLKDSDEAVIEVAKLFKGKEFQNDTTTVMMKFDDVMIGKIVKRAYDKRAKVFEGGKESKRDRNKANMDFSNTITAIANLEVLLKNAIPVTREKSTNNERYFSVASTERGDVAFRFSVDGLGNVKDMSSVKLEKSPHSKVSAQKNEALTEQGDIVSLTEFKRLFNAGREAKAYFQKKDQEKQTIAAINKDSLGFYSKLKNDVSAMKFGQMPAKDLINRLSKEGLYKKDELETTGIIEYLKTFEGKVSKEEVVSYLKNNGLQIKEIVLGDSGFEQGAEIFSLFTDNGDHMGDYSTRDAAEDAIETFQDEGSQALRDLEVIEDERDLTVGEKRRLDQLREQQDEYHIQVGEYDGQTIEDLESIESGATKYGNYIIGEKENYREILLTMPNAKGTYQSAHFDEDNVLAHTRITDSTNENGDKIMVVQEIQSDLHQEGKKKGYKKPEDAKKIDELNTKKQEMLASKFESEEFQSNMAKQKELEETLKVNSKEKSELDTEFEIGLVEGTLTEERAAEIEPRFKELQGVLKAFRGELRRYQRQEDDLRTKYEMEADRDSGLLEILKDKAAHSKQIPDAPFKQTEAWTMLVFKRILDMAVAQGYDSVQWTPAEVQIQRYEDAITSQVSEISYRKFGEKYALYLKDPRGNEIASPQESYTEEELETNLGKDLARKIVEGEGEVTAQEVMKLDYLKSLPPTLKGIAEEMIESKEEDLMGDAYTEGWDILTKEAPGIDHNIIHDIRDHDSDATKTLSGVDFKMGGKGMVDIYDKMMPKAIGKYVKKMDKNAKVGVEKMELEGEAEELSRDVVTVEVLEKARDLALDDADASLVKSFNEKIEDVKNGGVVSFSYLNPGYAAGAYVAKVVGAPKGKTQDMWSLPITEKMKEEISKGQPLFQKGDDSVKGLIQLGDGAALIKLFKTADKSTLLHEVGHLFLQELQSSVEGGLANDQSIKDLEVLKGFADGKFDVDGIEKIVEGFEAYLREGKAPTLELQGAFNNFKKWLTSIYKKFKDLPEINDEVRAVFDRMLATEEQINQAKFQYEAKESLASLMKEPKKVVRDMDDKKEKAVQTAEELLLAKYMKAYIKAAGGKKELNRIAKEQIEALPEFMAIEEIKVDGITEQEAVATIGQELVDDIKKKHPGVIKKKGKAIAGNIALNNDFVSPYEMLRDIAKAEKKSDAIKTRVNEFIEKKESEILANLDDRQGSPGEEELHNNDSAAFLIAEYELLSAKLTTEEKAREKKVSSQIYKDVAKETLLNKPTKLAGRYDLYAKTEQKFANQAYEFAKDGKYEKAAEAKKKQILNHIMVQEAVKLRDYKRKAENKYKTKAIAGKLKNIENDYAQIASKLINVHGLNKSIAPTDKTVPSIAVVDEMLFGQIPQWIEDGVSPSGKLNYKEMKMSEFIELDESIGSIIHSGRNTLLSLQAEDFSTIQDVVNLSVLSMSNLKDKKVDSEFSKKDGLYGRVEQTLVTGKNFISNSLADVVMIEYLFEELDNFKMHREKEFGILRRLFNRGREAEGKHKDLVSGVMAKGQTHFNILEDAKNSIEERKGKSFEIDGVPVPDLLKEAGKDMWTVEKMITFLLNTGNNHNLEVLTNSYQLSPQQVQIISSHFTGEQLQSIQGIWDATNSLFDQLDQTNFNIHNRHLTKVEANPIALIDNNGNEVILEGGYYPLAFDRSISDIAEKQQEDDMMKDRNSAVLRSSKPSDGMTKSRTGASHAIPPLLSMSVWTRHISDTARYISHAEYLRDMNRITNNPMWREVVRKKAGRKLYANIRDWLKFQARPERQIHGTWEKMLDKQKSMATSVILGLNMSVALKQRLSGLSAQTDLGGAWIMKSLRDADLKGSVLGLSTSDMWQEIMAKSSYIRARDGSMDREINDMMSNISPFINKFNIPGLDKKVSMKDARDAMFFLIQANDKAMTGVVWKAAYMKSLDATKNELDGEKAEKAAITFADSIVAQTQPSALPLDLNAMQKSEGAMRLFTAFSTWTFKQGNRFGHKYRAWQNGAITTKEYSEHVILEGLMAPWGAAIIGSLLMDGELPEWWEYITSPMEYGISWIPLVREVPSSIKYRQGIGSIPAFEGANRAVKTLETAYKWADGDKEYYDFLLSLGYTMEAVTGIPALKAIKNMNNTRLILTGEKKKRK